MFIDYFWKMTSPVLSKKKPLHLLRLIITGALVASFIYLSILFVQQHRQYETLSLRLEQENSPRRQQSNVLYTLFLAINEADDLFRLYTIDFNKSVYYAYSCKLEEINRQIDSLGGIQTNSQGATGGRQALEQKSNIQLELTALKKTVNNLILFSQDSLSLLQNEPHIQIPKAPIRNNDTLFRSISTDTALNAILLDTVIRKKQNLFKRIFKAQDDIVVANSVNQTLNIKQIDALYKTIQQLNIKQQQSFKRDTNLLREKFLALLQKERVLVQANYQLLDTLRSSIQTLRRQRLEKIRAEEKSIVTSHRLSADRFEKQIAVALLIMLCMISLILFYQSKASIYERRLRQEKEYASQVAEEKTSVLANISHEVRTPISSLLGIIDILKKNKADHVVSPEYLDSAVHEITVINSSINDILHLSKLEMGKLKVSYAFFSPHRILTEVINLHIYQAQKKGLVLTHDIQIDSGLEIFNSAFRVKQIVSNLLANAIKYTHKGSVHLSANLEYRNRKKALSIRVKDTGIGISLEHQQHIFRQYYMAGSKAKTGGFGLGLYISNLLVKQLEGQIDLISAPETGSTFEVTIPTQNIRVVPQKKEQLRLTDLPKNTRLVFIDDNRINIMYLRHYFKDSSRITLFENPAEALHFIQNNEVHVVITDMFMPAVNGWTILDKTKETNQNISVFLCTADLVNTDAQRKSSINQFNAILSKPINEHELVSKILEQEER
ncbi:ATP-binding response regulator [Sphingobacterium paludis]|uniref:histidine kinase n=1 Tax=Sphingobacterium paludis TaxID=1476465 RepID=A0A4R7CYT6_9SPHI|nr:ATP-binding protein [Sphingobacterium paludis]TDS13759.1 signal transduction histidine kinase [Sphingobacterium paludis]